MANKIFKKIWSGVLTSFFMLPAKGSATIKEENVNIDINNHLIEAKETSTPDLFLKQAKDLYGNSMLFTGHRSHSSHRSHRSHSSHKSHYSSRISTPAPSYTPPSSYTAPKKTYTTPEKKSINSSNTKSTYKKTNSVNPFKKYINTTNTKMIQITLNLLGYKAGKVDGLIGSETQLAIEKFHKIQKIDVVKDFNPQTCLQLAIKIKDKFPNDQDVKKLHDHLLKLYIKMTLPDTQDVRQP